MTELLTIGYEQSRIDDVIAALKQARVALLIDVRAVAASRKPGFSKRQLAACLDEAGMRYLHLQALGTPKPGRDAVRAGHPERMVPIYRAHIAGDRQQAELAQAISLARTDRVCLLCFERDPAHCHRRLVAEMIVQQTGQQVIDLLPARP
jgi:uncharacterized protein (DUF488 family)